MAATNDDAELTVAEAKEEEEATHNGGGWLRAVVLGTSDGLISTVSLMLGIARRTPPTSVSSSCPG
uniref:Uncharacterized protein n=2 Tax=Oryza TaxID=4527 RepID=A0A0E0R9N4_ORYRU